MSKSLLTTALLTSACMLAQVPIGTPGVGRSQYSESSTVASAKGAIILGKDSANTVRTFRLNASGQVEVVCASGCTTDPSGVTDLGSCGINSDETAAVQQADCYLRVPENQPIVLREGQGLMVRNTALAPVGLMSVFIQFTVI